MLDQAIDKLGNKIFERKAGEINPSQLEFYIGKRVKIYPKGDRNGESYDCGGCTDSVPAGSEGIVGHISNSDKTKLIVRFENKVGDKKSKLDGKYGWAVKLREVKLVESSFPLPKEYNLNKEVRDSILSKDYDALVGILKKQYFAEDESRLYSLKQTFQKLRGFINHVDGLR